MASFQKRRLALVALPVALISVLTIGIAGAVPPPQAHSHKVVYLNISAAHARRLWDLLPEGVLRQAVDAAELAEQPLSASDRATETLIRYFESIAQGTPWEERPYDLRIWAYLPHLYPGHGLPTPTAPGLACARSSCN